MFVGHDALSCKSINSHARHENNIQKKTNPQKNNTVSDFAFHFLLAACVS